MDETRQEITEAKRKLILAYMRTKESDFTELDSQLFHLLSQDASLQDEQDKARKNN